MFYKKDRVCELQNSDLLYSICFHEIFHWNTFKQLYIGGS